MISFSVIQQPRSQQGIHPDCLKIWLKYKEKLSIVIYVDWKAVHLFEMGSQDMGESEKGKEEKVEGKKDELNEEKRKLPGLFGEVNLSFALFMSLWKETFFHYRDLNHQIHFLKIFSQIRSLVVLAVPLFLSSASWVTTIIFFIISTTIMMLTHQVGMKATDTALLGHLQEEGTTYLRSQDE